MNNECFKGFMGYFRLIKKVPHLHTSHLHYYTYNGTKPANPFPYPSVYATQNGYKIIKDKKQLVPYPECNTYDEVKKIQDSSDNYHVEVTEYKDCQYIFTERDNIQMYVAIFVKMMERILDEHADFNTIYYNTHTGKNQRLDKFPNFVEGYIKNPPKNEEGHVIPTEEDLEKMKYLQSLFQSAKDNNLSIKWVYFDEKDESLFNIYNEHPLLNNSDVIERRFKMFNETSREVVTTREDLKAVLNGSDDGIHPFLKCNKIYMDYPNETGVRHANGIYLVGNPGDLPKKDKDNPYSPKPEQHIGKLVSDMMLGVVDIGTNDTTLDTVGKVQDEVLDYWQKHHNFIYHIDTNNLQFKKPYQHVRVYGESVIVPCDTKQSHLSLVDGRDLTYVAIPLWLAQSNLERAPFINRVRTDIVRHHFSPYIVQDITDAFYQTQSVSVGNEKVMVGKGLIGKEDERFVQVRLQGKCPITSRDIDFNLRLLYNIEMPKINVMKQLSKLTPVIKLVAWHSTGDLYRYGIFIQLHEKTLNKTPEGEHLYVQTANAFFTSPTSSQFFI